MVMCLWPGKSSWFPNIYERSSYLMEQPLGVSLVLIKLQPVISRRQLRVYLMGMCL